MMAMLCPANFLTLPEEQKNVKIQWNLCFTVTLLGGHISFNVRKFGDMSHYINYSFGGHLIFTVTKIIASWLILKEVYCAYILTVLKIHVSMVAAQCEHFRSHSWFFAIGEKITFRKCECHLFNTKDDPIFRWYKSFQSVFIMITAFVPSVYDETFLTSAALPLYNRKWLHALRLIAIALSGNCCKYTAKTSCKQHFLIVQRYAQLINVYI